MPKRQVGLRTEEVLLHACWVLMKVWESQGALYCAFCTAVLLNETVHCSWCGSMLHADKACCGVGNRVTDCLLNDIVVLCSISVVNVG